VKNFNAQDISNAAWAFAKADSFCDLLFLALATVAERRLRTFKTQELVNTA